MIDYQNPILSTLFIKLYLIKVTPSISHPGSKISIRVLFSSISNKENLYAQFTNANDGFSLRSPNPCKLSEINLFVCEVPSSINKFGYYILQMVDINNFIQNDSHLLRLEIIANPTLLPLVIPANIGYHGTGPRFISVSLAESLNANIMSSTFCNIGPYQQKTQALVKSPTEILCLINGTHYKSQMPLCVEITVNYGFDTTKTCAASVSSYRFPVISNFAPTFLSVERSTGNINIYGQKFSNSYKYACVLMKTTEIDYISIGNYISDTQISCNIQKSRFNSTYIGDFAIYADSVLVYKNEMKIIKDIKILNLAPNSGPSTGGTLVTLKLSEKINLIDGISWKCRISSTFEAADPIFLVNAQIIDSQTIKCTMPDVSSNIGFTTTTYTEFYISVIQYDLQISKELTRFTFYKPPTVSSVIPDNGYIDKENVVKLLGNDFLGWNTLSAKLVWSDGEKILIPLFINVNTVIVNIPIGIPLSHNNMPNVKIYISNNGYEFSDTFATYSVKIPPTLHDIIPRIGSNLGGTFVQILGSRFTETVQSCKFGNLIVPATYVSPSNITCIAPQPEAHTSTVVRISLLFLPDTEILDNELYYQYGDVNIITEFVPAEYQITGGINIIITGNFQAFINSSPIDILFGGIVATKTTLINSTTINAVLPPCPNAKFVGVSLRVGQTEYTNEYLFFEYKDYGSMTSITPTHGPSYGKNGIFVTGTGFLYNSLTFCVIDNTYYMPVSYVNETQLDCVMPPHKPGQVSVEIMFNNLYTTTTGIKYSYDPDVEVQSFSLTYIPIEGNVPVIASGRNFPSTYPVTFLIGGVSAIGEYVSSTQMKLTVPTQNEYGLKEIKISTNGYNYVLVNGLYVYYHKLIYLNGISPDTIPANKPNKITLTGENFPISPLGTINCQVNGINYEANVLSSQQLECNLPSYNFADITTLPVSISLDSVSLHGKLYITVYPNIEILSIQPNSATEYTKDLFVYITISGGFIDTQNLACFIGDQKAILTMRQSPTQIKCLLPQFSVGEYSVSVTNNGIDIVKSDSVTFTVRPAPVVIWVEPRYIQKVKNFVLVGGYNFWDTSELECYFEPVDSQIAITEQFITEGVYMGKEQIMCNTPQFDSVTENSMFNVRIAVFNKEWSATFAQITVLQTNPGGYYFSQSALLGCPAGSFCNSDDSNAPRLCPPGYYQAKQKQMNCTECPISYICPNTGMKEPLKCPSGHICDKPGLVWPLKVCPLGYFCYSGTRLEFSTGSDTVSEPQVCERGTYCLERSNTGVVLRNLMQSAKICKQGFICPRGSKSQYGIGACPVGFYCPSSEHIGIPCPPRTYCPNRGSIKPLPCPPGTFNTNFGQQNCTKCPMGYICPMPKMLIPIKCPPGYICNKEGLIQASNVCTGGYICEGGVKSASVKKLCDPINNIETASTECPYGVFVSGTDVLQAADYDSSYKGQAYLCCWNKTTVGTFVKRIGKLFGEDETESPMPDYARYSEEFEKAGVDGIKLLKWLAGKVTSKDLGISIPKAKLKKVWIAADLMFREPKQVICPGGLFCLPGATSLNRQTSLGTTPYVCPPGTYCKKGSSSGIGTGYCPSGFYCPRESETPIETDPGYFTPRPGAVEQVKCYPGYYTMRTKSTSCSKCPSGFECKSAGTSWPNICRQGQYRSWNESNVCLPCPEGTFMPVRGGSSAYECFNCPPGKICSTPGSSSLSMATSCTDGYLCAAGTNKRNILSCPEGFYCPKGTSPENYQNNRCPSGFYCPVATGENNRFFSKCPHGFFCPNGSKYYNEFLETNVTIEECPTKCPEGTGLDSSEGSRALLDCKMGDQFSIFNPTSSTQTQGRLLIESIASQKSVLSLIEVQDIIYDYTRSGGLLQSDGFNEVNIKRNYIRMWDPIDYALSISPDSTYNDSVEGGDSSLPIGVYNLNEMSMLLLTMDLRHLHQDEKQFIYGYDWAISITLGDSLIGNEVSKPAYLPETLLNNATNKADVIQLAIQTYVAMKARAEILLYSGHALSHKLLFSKSTSVYRAKANRALYNTSKTFVAVISNTLSVTLPMNMPILDQFSKYPTHQINYASIEGKPVRHRNLDGKTIFVPSSLYWQGFNEINIPFLPYFSNCKGYGEAIHLWELFELHPKCKLVPYNETKYISQFAFGSYPNADTCTDIEIGCTYDEIFVNMQSNPRWFEVPAGTTLMYISKEPMQPSHMSRTKLTETEYLAVDVLETRAGGRVVPSKIKLKFMYFQKSQGIKTLIKVKLDFLEYKTLNDAEFNGDDLVDYKLLIDYVPLSHKELMVEFALDIQFYILLYVILGIATISVNGIFTVYHRLTAQSAIVPSFKFLSYLKFNLCPLSGLIMALIPIAILVLIIEVLISGHFMLSKFSLYPCDSSNLEDCKTTIFDNIPASIDAKDVDYTGMRYTRTALALFVLGIYLMVTAAKLLVPNKNPKLDIAESYSGNIWRPHVWKRSKIIIASFFLMPFMLYLLKFSMSSYFGENIWVCIIGYKLLQAFMEEVLLKMTACQLLMVPNAVVCDLMGGIFTFGADDFLTFLKSAFIDLGVLMIDRAYFGPCLGIITNVIEDFIDDVKEYFQNHFFKGNGEIEDGRSPRNEQREENDQDDSDDSSRISNDPVFIEESSLEQNKEDSKENKDDAQISYEESMLDEIIEEKKEEKEAKDQDKKSENEKESKKKGEDNENGEGSEEDAAEPPLDMYAGFARNNLSQWLNIVSVVLLYIFYKETQIGSGYGIRIEDFSYYIIFILFYFPFQTINEIFFLNVSEWFWKCPIHDYTDYLSLRYANRQTSWKGDDRDINPSLDEEFQVLDQWGFSSQYYFTQTLYIVGMLLCIFSIQIWTTGPYNPFSDLCTFLIIPLVVIMCRIVHSLSLIIGGCLGIWQVKRDVAAEQAKRENDIPLYQLFEALQGPKKQAHQKKLGKINLGFSKDQWRRVEMEQRRLDWIKPDLYTDRIIAQTYREMFLELNKPLPVDVVYHYLTRSVRQNQREQIVQEFKKIFDRELKPTNIQQINTGEASPAHPRIMVHENIDVQMSSATTSLIGKWLTRARLRRVLRFQIARVIEGMKAQRCDNCRNSGWLKVECDDEILDLFDKFIKEEGGNESNYNVLTWRRFFRRNAKVHTTCMECRVPELPQKSQEIMARWLAVAKQNLA